MDVGGELVIGLLGALLPADGIAGGVDVGREWVCVARADGVGVRFTGGVALDVQAASTAAAVAADVAHAAATPNRKRNLLVRTCFTLRTRLRPPRIGLRRCRSLPPHTPPTP